MAKQPKTIYPAYFIPELAHVVAMCDEKLPFYALIRALSKRKLSHSGLQVEAKSTSLVLKLLALPIPDAKTTVENKVIIIIGKVRSPRRKHFKNFILLNIFLSFSISLHQPLMPIFPMLY